MCLIKISHIDLNLDGLKKRLVDSNSIVIVLEWFFEENVGLILIFFRFLNETLDVKYKTVFSVVIILDFVEHRLAFFLMVECERALHKDHKELSLFGKLGKRIPSKWYGLAMLLHNLIAICELNVGCWHFGICFNGDFVVINSMFVPFHFEIDTG